MKGFQVVTFRNATYHKDFRQPVGATEVLKTWVPTRDEAETKLSEAQREYDGISELRS